MVILYLMRQIRIQPPRPIQRAQAQERANKLVDEEVLSVDQGMEYFKKWEEDQEVITQFDKMNVTINAWYDDNDEGSGIPEVIKKIYKRENQKNDDEHDEDYEFRIKLSIYSDFLTIDTASLGKKKLYRKSDN